MDMSHFNISIPVKLEGCWGQKLNFPKQLGDTLIEISAFMYSILDVLFKFKIKCQRPLCGHYCAHVCATGASLA